MPNERQLSPRRIRKYRERQWFRAYVPLTVHGRPHYFPPWAEASKPWRPLGAPDAFDSLGEDTLIGVFGGFPRLSLLAPESP